MPVLPSRLFMNGNSQAVRIPAVVRIEAPPPQRVTDPLLLSLPTGEQLLRIYRPYPYGSSACGFRPAWSRSSATRDWWKPMVCAWL